MRDTDAVCTKLWVWPCVDMYVVLTDSMFYYPTCIHGCLCIMFILKGTLFFFFTASTELFTV